MKITYRLGMFESNSSSTHSIVIGMKDDFKKWENGELIYYRYGKNSFCTKEEAIKTLKELSWYRDIDFDTIDPDLLAEYLTDEGFETWEQFDENEYLENDYNEFVTPKGEKICVLCRYGWDG